MVSLIYDEIEGFSEGLAATKSNNGKWGFVDRDGNVVIPFKYGWVGRFAWGVAAATYNGKTGAIDRHDNVVIPFAYRSAEGFQAKGKFLVYDDRWQAIYLDVEPRE